MWVSPQKTIDIHLVAALPAKVVQASRSNIWKVIRSRSNILKRATKFESTKGSCPELVKLLSAGKKVICKQQQKFFKKSPWFGK